MNTKVFVKEDIYFAQFLTEYQNIFSDCPSLLKKRSDITFHTETVLISLAARRQSESPKPQEGSETYARVGKSVTLVTY